MIAFFPIFLILYEFAANLSNDMYVAAMPEIVQDFASRDQLVALTMTAWLLGSSSIELLMGPLSDRYGRRPVLFIGGAIFLLSSLGCAVAPGLIWLIVARFFQGLGVCALMVAGYAAVHEWYPDQKAVSILAWLGTATVVAPMVGPIIGGELLYLGDWRLIFWVILALAVVGLAGLWLVMPESNILRDREALKPRRFMRVYLRVAQNLRFMLSAISYGFGYSGLYVWIAVSSFVLIELLKKSPEKYGLVQMPIFGAYFIGAKGIKYLLPHVIRRYEVMWGIVIAFLSSCGLVVATIIWPNDALSMLIPMAVYAFGWGMAAAPINRRTLTATTESRGSAIAVFYFVMMIASVLGTLSITLFYNQTLLSASLIIAVLITISFIVEVVRALVYT